MCLPDLNRNSRMVVQTCLVTSVHLQSNKKVIFPRKAFAKTQTLFPFFCGSCHRSVLEDFIALSAIFEKKKDFYLLKANFAPGEKVCKLCLQ